MIYLAPSLRRRRLSLAIGTSTLAWVLAGATAANAQCAPDPTATNGTTTCTGSDTDGLTVATPGTQVVVSSGATVVPGSAAAAISIRSTNNQLTVNGLVDGSGKPGIAVIAGPPFTGPCDPYAGAGVIYCTPGSPQTYYPSASATITVAAGGTVRGSQALLVDRDPGNTQGFLSVSVVNAGTMAGTAGPAIVARGSNNGLAYLTVSNLATGTIGGISGAISSVTNAGLIDGSSNAAIAGSSASGGLSVYNTGQLLSSGSAATVSSAGGLYVTNSAGATLGGSATALSAAGLLSLVNAGTINGSVVSTGTSNNSSTIDTRDGVINGNLILGAGNDTLLAKFDAITGRVSSITGTVDGGAGTDTVTIGIDSDATMAAVVLPTNFELLGMNLANNATVTLAPGFTSGTGVALSGGGNVINKANLVTTGPAVIANAGVSALSLVNDGSITATLTNSYDTALRGLTKLTNNGTIDVVGGDGVRGGSLINSGTITATGFAVVINSGSLANSGTIRSTGATGASISGNGSTNDGSIIGALAGVNVGSGVFVNNGTVTGGTSGVDLGYSATLINNAGGTVTGGAYNKGLSTRVINAGTIDGPVDLVRHSGFDSSDDIFVDTGGTVSGAISLGGGSDRLVLDLVAQAGRPLAGAIGGVDGGDGFDTLHYRVNADASATMALTNGFEGLAYELDHDATLTLTAASPLTTTLGITGNGTVTLAGTLSGADTTLVDATILTEAQLTRGTRGPDQALSITNNGTLNLSSTPSFGYVNRFAVNAGTADFTNNGTIAVTNAAGTYYPAGGIFNGNAVTNTGAITVSGGGTAISNARTVVNSGTIMGAPGSASIGVTAFATLDNSGTIQVDGNAVQGSYSTSQITNSGLIESRLGTAVLISSSTVLTNGANGTLRGVTAVDITSGGSVVNRGAIVGNISAYAFSYGNAAYIADGGTLTGNLTFGAGNDLFVMAGDETGVSGTIDGGNGEDLFGYSRNSSATIALGGNTPMVNFEGVFVQANGADTVATLTAAQPFAGLLYANGDGTVVNTAEIKGAVSATRPFSLGQALPYYYGLARFENAGIIAGGVTGNVAKFSNSGTIGSSTLATGAVVVGNTGGLDFDNSGEIRNSGATTVSLDTMMGQTLNATNSGVIEGSGFRAGIAPYFNGGALPNTRSVLTLNNSGTISSDVGRGTAADLSIVTSGGRGNALTLVNSGTIEARGAVGTAAMLEAYDFSGRGVVNTISVTNSGTIRANGGGVEDVAFAWPTTPPFNQTIQIPNTLPAMALAVVSNPGTTVTITNAATGLIEATGPLSTAIGVYDAALDLTNDGTIRGGMGTVLAADDVLVGVTGRPYLAGAIQAIGEANDRIVNNGAILGSVDLNAGDDRIENYGRIEGDVFLGLGDDTFLQRASATLIGTVDAGDGTDSFIVDATGGGSVNGDQFINFEQFSQIGEGSVTYAGNFQLATIDVSGGTVTVAAGQTLRSASAITVTGGNDSETLRNDGTVAGAVDLGAGNDEVFNNGTIEGVVSLGAGDDSFVDGPNSDVGGPIEGGAGTDRYTFVLAGNRAAGGAVSGFERLLVQGTGTLTFVSQQDWESIALTGAALNLTLGGHSVGTVTGSDGNEQLMLDGDVGTATFGAGDDTLGLGTVRATGRYLGGAGSDALRFTAGGPILLTGSATGFEQLLLAGGVLNVAGTLGAAGDTVAFGAGNQQLFLSASGTLVGNFDLGAGDDSFALSAGATLNGTISGGAGTDSATLQLVGDTTLMGGMLTDFEILHGQGPSRLSLRGAHGYASVTLEGDLTILGDATLAAGQLQLGTGDNRLSILGQFVGSVDGGAGTDTLTVSGGSAGAPVAFGSIANVETLGISGGYATISGSALFTSIDLTGGRLVGLAGSTIGATNLFVRQGATFGSAGTVNGNLSVAGILSPGASPGTMTVNGNIALAATSVSLFELSATLSDKLVVNGAVSIAQGATLQLVATQDVTPGRTLDLIVASGGITGSYTNILKPASLFGIIVQQSNRISLLGEFLNSDAFSPQAQRSITYVNTVLRNGQGSTALLAAVPQLASAWGASNAAAFARLSPEAYASASQITVEHGLGLADAGRGDAFAVRRDTPGGFTFASGLANFRTLEGGAQGTVRAQTNDYGFLGGIGWGSDQWSLGAFLGYLNSRQTLAGRSERTETDGFVAGVHGRWTSDGLGVKATLAYDRGDATTRRVLPDGAAKGDYTLQGWTADLSIDYAMPLSGSWVLRPSLGATAIRSTRAALAETGSSAFALDVARERADAIFIDGALTFRGGTGQGAKVRPYLSIGARYQAEGRMPYALGALGGGDFGLLAAGVSRATVLATATLGGDVALSQRLVLFGTLRGESGDADYRASARAGLRLSF